MTDTEKTADNDVFSLDDTLELYELFQVPKEERDQDWVRDFFEVIPNASLRGFEPQMQRGPDGFPYLMLSLPESGEEFDAFSVGDSVEYCLKAGCGIALFANPKKLEQPEWVFSFGSLWSYQNFKNFIGDPNDEIPSSEEEVKKNQEKLSEPRDIQVATPSDDYFPKFARLAVSRFLKDTIGLEKPRVALVIDPILKPSRALMFADLQPSRFEKEEHFVYLMQALRWFLPSTRGLMAGIPQIAEHARPIE